MDKEKFDQWAEERRQRRAQRDARRQDRRGSSDSDHGGEAGRGRGERKERVLHTRISDQLDDSLRRAADEMRVPVSNLVRNVLEDVFSVVETVTENVGDMVSEIMDEADDVRDRVMRHKDRWTHRSHRDRREHRDVTPDDAEGRAAEREVEELLDEDRERQEFPNIVGWQPFVLNAAQQCADCGRDLRKGDRAFLGHANGATSGDPPWLCTECLGARS